MISMLDTSSSKDCKPAVHAHDMNTFPFPTELIERILTFCRPYDVVSFSTSCRVAYSTIYNSSYQYLWRELFLSYPFDDPRRSNPYEGSAINWREELIRRIKAEQTAYDPTASQSSQVQAVQVFLNTILNAPSSSHSAKPCSDDLRWVEATLGNSYLPNEVSQDSIVDQLLCSHLKSYTTLLSELHTIDLDSQLHRTQRRNKSRLFVYGMQNYIGKRYWGPFNDQGFVDWEHVEHLVNVTVCNLLELPGSWRGIIPPAGLEATRRWSAPDVSGSGVDWAGVEGTWRRYVCYMDYRQGFIRSVLFCHPFIQLTLDVASALNFSVFTGGQPDPSFFDCPRFREGSRLLEITLRLVQKDQLGQRTLEAINCEDIKTADSRWPVLFYTGLARGIDGINATVEGTVHMGLDGVARWKFVSDYSDRGEWNADAAQLGNIGSAMGIIGVWTTPYHDDGDPIGPFWMWKVANGSGTYLMDCSA